MTNQTWEKIRKNVAALDGYPHWFKQFAEFDWGEIHQLSRFLKLDDTIDGQTAMPVVEEKVVTEDYLFFLHEQIELKARGQEWTDRLEKRLNALKPFIGKVLIAAHFYQKPHSVTLMVDPKTDKLVNAEYF